MYYTSEEKTLLLRFGTELIKAVRRLLYYGPGNMVGQVIQTSGASSARSLQAINEREIFNSHQNKDEKVMYIRPRRCAFFALKHRAGNCQEHAGLAYILAAYGLITLETVADTDALKKACTLLKEKKISIAFCNMSYVKNLEPFEGPHLLCIIGPDKYFANKRHRLYVDLVGKEQIGKQDASIGEELLIVDPWPRYGTSSLNAKWFKNYFAYDTKCNKEGILSINTKRQLFEPWVIPNTEKVSKETSWYWEKQCPPLETRVENLYRYLEEHYRIVHMPLSQNPLTLVREGIENDRMFPGTAIGELLCSTSSSKSVQTKLSSVGLNETVKCLEEIALLAEAAMKTARKVTATLKKCKLSGKQNFKNEVQGMKKAITEVKKIVEAIKKPSGWLPKQFSSTIDLYEKIDKEFADELIRNTIDFCTYTIKVHEFLCKNKNWFNFSDYKEENNEFEILLQESRNISEKLAKLAYHAKEIAAKVHAFAETCTFDHLQPNNLKKVKPNKISKNKEKKETRDKIGNKNSPSP